MNPSTAARTRQSRAADATAPNATGSVTRASTGDGQAAPSPVDECRCHVFSSRAAHRARRLATSRRGSQRIHFVVKRCERRRIARAITASQARATAGASNRRSDSVSVDVHPRAKVAGRRNLAAATSPPRGRRSAQTIRSETDCRRGAAGRQRLPVIARADVDDPESGRPA